MLRLFRPALVVLALVVGLGTAPNQAAAQADQQDLVDEARITLQKMLRDPDHGNLAYYVRNASAVIIFPELVKGGFIVGAEGGSGVMLARGTDGSWSSPAFVTLASASLGLQIGGQVSEVVLTIMRPAAVMAILNDELKFGADASVAVGPVGAGVEAATSTADFNDDVYAFSSAKGLFGGGSIEGAVISARESYNATYYGSAGATSRAILLERGYNHPGAETLRQALPR